MRVFKLLILCVAIMVPVVMEGAVSHDIQSLSKWGPYSKEYFGISHIDDPDSGIQVEFCLVAGQYRRNFKVPCALFESGVHPWDVSPDMRHITYRHDIEWKDRVFADATWHVIDDDRVILEVRCVNNTDQPQNISLQLAVRKAGGASGQWDPEIQEGKGFFTVKYPEVEPSYTVVWDYLLSEVRTWQCAKLEHLMPLKVHNHTSKTLKGDLKGHWTANFLRPVTLLPGRDTTIRQMIVKKDFSTTLEMTKYETPNLSFRPSEAPNLSFRPSEARGEISNGCPPLGVRLLQATLLTNVVYTIDAFGEPIRHFCPGKNWNSLYTWDCGFIGWAMAEIDPGRGYEIIRQYTTAPEEEAPFVHHGTPLATQILAIGDVWERGGCDEAQLREIYPRLKRFYDYMTGPDFRKASGLLATWNIFYNSGGWDDYPPQWMLRPQKELRARTTPMVSTSYYIRCGKILRLMASHLAAVSKKAEKKAFLADVKKLESDIAAMSKGILDNAWDPESGYFAYVEHDEEGRAKCRYIWKPEMGIPAQDGTRAYKGSSESTNFDRGLDGVAPLVAGIVTDSQREALLGHIFTKGELWSDCGITAVDQSAPYYRKDGYWNGTVWMPHQMILWKTMLDLGLPERARQIAETALSNWERECEDSYNCYEHFMIETGRGGGWHNFSGLSSPILNWWNAYNKPGTLSTGFGTLVTSAKWQDGNSAVTATLEFDRELVGRDVSLIACLSSGPKEFKVRATKKPLTITLK